MLVTEPAVTLNCTFAVAVALRLLAAAPGLFLAVQAERRQFGAVPSGLPFTAKALAGLIAVQPLGAAPVRGLLKLGLSAPSRRLRSTMAWMVRDTLVASTVPVIGTRHCVAGSAAPLKSVSSPAPMLMR